MKHFVHFLCFFLLNTPIVVAQLQVTDATQAPLTPENLISNYFLGSGVEVTSITYEGGPNGARAVGYFDGGQTATGINRGIVMTTGRATTNNPTLPSGGYGINAFSSEQASTDNLGMILDPDITKIAGGNSVHDLIKYTIKFIPVSDTLRFRYAFGSEEYPEYSCASFNDVFGFFISGPGINGTFQNNGVNIARVPGSTNTPVSINNIHPNNGAGCNAKNAQFYNTVGTSSLPVYDGMLDVFTAQAIVQPCKEYTIKLIIADLGDGIYDSGVFLEAKSFGTGSLKVQANTVSLDGTLAEGCKSGSVSFSLPQKVKANFPIDIKIIGTATNGIDYQFIPTSFIIPKGDSTVSVPLVAIEDNLPEGIESIGFDVQRDPCNRDTIWAYIKDNTIVAPKLANDTTLCLGKSLQLNGTLNVPLPQDPVFTFNGSIDIDPPTQAVNIPLNVFGVQPIELQAGMIKSVCMNIQHKFDDDLDIYLFGPDGQFIELVTDNGSSGDNYTQTCFTPTATKPITYIAPPASGAPYTGDFKPEGQWDDLWDGGKRKTNGKWQLVVIDDTKETPPKIGKVLNWSITFNPIYRLSYTWSPKDSLSCSNCPTPIAKPITTTNYTLQVADSYGCVVSDSIKITIPKKMLSPTVFCKKTLYNSITFGWDAILGATSYQVNVNGTGWISANGNLEHLVTGLGLSQNVKIEVRAIGDCDNSVGVGDCTTLACPGATPNILVVKDISCNGKKDGFIQLNATGNQPPFTFKIGGASNATGVFPNLAGGSYTVSVVDQTGCASTAQVTIKEPLALTTTAKADSTSCAGNSNSRAWALPKGGTQPYSFAWSDFQTDSIALNLPSGNYKLTVTDKNGCQATTSTAIFDPAPISVVTQSFDVSCAGLKDGVGKIIASGGKPPYFYTWDSQASNQVTASAIGLAAGAYNFTVKDAGGCQYGTFLNIGEPSALNAFVNATDANCAGGTNGTAIVQSSGGTPTYTYEWSNGKTTALVDSLMAGKYLVTVTDKSGCTIKDSVTIQAPNPLTLALVKTDVLCFGTATGTAQAIPSGGAVPYSYLWSNSQVTDIANALKVGYAFVTLTDDKGCTIKDSIKLTQPTALNIVGNIKAIACNGSGTGGIDVTVTGGAMPYSYVWTGNNGFSSTSDNLINLDKGTYKVIITDNNNCTFTSADFIVTEASSLKDFVYTPTNVKCYEGKDGSIQIKEGTGGKPPYSYKWTNNLGTFTATTASIANLEAAQYNLTITDANGCETTQKFNIEQPNKPLLLTISPNDTICVGTKTGSLGLSIEEGTAPYTYLWSNNDKTDFQNNLPVGQYSVTVTDAHGCTISNKAEVVAAETAKLTLSQTAPACANGKDGTASVDAITYNGVNAPLSTFTFAWQTAGNTAKEINLEGGKSYIITVTDLRGCIVKDSIKITNPSPVVLTLESVKDVKCATSTDGEASVKATGGSSPYLYAWDGKANNQLGATATSLSPDSYSVVATDKNGCTASLVVKINVPTPLQITLGAEAVACSGGNSGIANVLAQGGTTPYTYLWSNSATSSTIKNLSAATYTVTVTDKNNCQTTGTVQVKQPGIPLEASVLAIDETCFGAKDGRLQTIAKGGTPPYQYSLDNKKFNGLETRVGLKAGDYTVYVQDSKGCILETKTVTITAPPKIEVDLGKDTTIFYGDTIRLKPLIVNGQGTLTYSWTQQDTAKLSCTNCLNPFGIPPYSTIYKLRVTDSKGCYSTAQQSIYVEIKSDVVVPTGFSPNNDGVNEKLTVYGPKGAKILYFVIFDRWGEKLYEQSNFNINDNTTGWDGTFRGEGMSSGNYVWRAQVQFANGQIGEYKGGTMLIR
jgi:gliding motility-associated-like protein